MFSLLRESLWHFFLCRTHNDRAKGGTHRSKRNLISIDWVIYWLFIYWNISFIHKWSYGTRVDFTNIKGTPNVLNSSHVTYVDVRDYVSDSILIFFYPASSQTCSARTHFGFSFCQFFVDKLFLAPCRFLSFPESPLLFCSYCCIWKLVSNKL